MSFKVTLNHDRKTRSTSQRKIVVFLFAVAGGKYLFFTSISCFDLFRCEVGWDILTPVLTAFLS